MWNTFEEMLEQHAASTPELRPAFDALPKMTEEWEHLITAFIVCRQAAEEECAGEDRHHLFITALTCRTIHDHIPTADAERLLATIPVELDTFDWGDAADKDATFRVVLALSSLAKEVSDHMFRTSIAAPLAEA